MYTDLPEKNGMEDGDKKKARQRHMRFWEVRYGERRGLIGLKATKVHP